MATLARELRSKHWSASVALFVVLACLVAAAFFGLSFALSGTSFGEFISNNVVGGLMWRKPFGLMW